MRCLETPPTRHCSALQTTLSMFTAPSCYSRILPQVLSLALWDKNSASFDAARLPTSADPQLRAFFSSTALSHARGSSEWFDFCSARPGLRYISGSAQGQFELYPSAETFVDAIESFVGVRPASPTHDALVPLWPGCEVGPPLLSPAAAYHVSSSAALLINSVRALLCPRSDGASLAHPPASCSLSKSLTDVLPRAPSLWAQTWSLNGCGTRSMALRIADWRRQRS